jgi:hypothetical protein
MQVFLFPFLGISAAVAAPPAGDPVLPGFVVHFDFIANVQEARQLVAVAQAAGAKVINLVPPAHMWDNALALQMFDAILAEIDRRDLRFVLTRIDASSPPDPHGRRFNYLYGRILTEPGYMPNGKETSGYFRTTAGRPRYVEWMEEETRYYARRCGRSPRLIGINLGPFSEPFSSERGGFLEWMDETGTYEITQYDPDAENLWHKWLLRRYRNSAALDAEYGTAFPSIEAVPLPRSESDARFARAELAYYDFARCLNDWFEDCYERCRRLWHAETGRNDVPFILQLSGGEPEKFVNGRPSFAAFDMTGWVARADAVGISVYSNSGFPDLGHASIESTVNVLSFARELGKQAFVLEGGYEAPNVLLDPAELSYFGTVARRLSPRTYIYEFLKDKFDDPYTANPGKPVTARGRIRRPAFEALRKLFAELRSAPMEGERPGLYVRLDAGQARGNRNAGILNGALYDLASDFPVRWAPANLEATLQPGVPVLGADGTLNPPNPELSALLQKIPPSRSNERVAWKKAVIDAIGRGTPGRSTLTVPLPLRPDPGR